jgi:hypothetical protein
MVSRGTRVPSLACALCIGVSCDIFERAANPLEGAQCHPSDNPCWSHNGPRSMVRIGTRVLGQDMKRAEGCILGSRSHRYVTNSGADALEVDDSGGV